MPLGRKRMLARFSVLDKYECPTDFFWQLHFLGSMDPEAKSAAPSVTKKYRLPTVWQGGTWVGAPSLVIPAKDGKASSRSAQCYASMRLHITYSHAEACTACKSKVLPRLPAHWAHR